MHRQPQPQSDHARQQHDHAQRTHAHHASVPGVEFDLAAVHALAVLPPTLTASLFLPTHRAGSDTPQDHIRLKNMLHEARSLMLGADAAPALDKSVKSAKNLGDVEDKEREARVDMILAPALALLEARLFWAHPQDGLALFCSDQGLRQMWLPAAIPELVVVGAHCHVKPLMPLLQGDGDFYMLELTQHGVLLHAGSRFALRTIALPGAPDSTEAALGVIDGEHRAEVRTVHRNGHDAGHGGSVYLGTVGDDDAKERIKQYFRRIDSSVCSLLHAQHAPLVTAGVGYLLPLYWDVNRYQFLIQAGISNNTDLLTIGALHDRAWEIVAPHFSKADDAARERYGQLRGSARASDDLATILRAVYQGRVEDLFIASDTERWGTYDPLADKLREHEPRTANDADLLNTALIQALVTRVRTQVVPRAQMPAGSSDVAAVFRYS